jgi:hypothetical protein
MSDAYEKDITRSLGSARELILLGARADADIDYRDKRINELRAKVALLEKVVECAIDRDRRGGDPSQSGDAFGAAMNLRQALRAAGYEVGV